MYSFAGRLGKSVPPDVGACVIGSVSASDNKNIVVTGAALGFCGAENLGLGNARCDFNTYALEIGLQFLDDPTTEPDAACMDGLAGPDFN